MEAGQGLNLFSSFPKDFTEICIRICTVVCCIIWDVITFNCECYLLLSDKNKQNVMVFVLLTKLLIERGTEGNSKISVFFLFLNEMMM